MVICVYKLFLTYLTRSSLDQSSKYWLKSIVGSKYLWWEQALKLKEGGFLWVKGVGVEHINPAKMMVSGYLYSGMNFATKMH